MDDGIQTPQGDLKPKSRRGGFRPGAGRKPGPPRYVSREDLLKILHEESPPQVITVLFLDAAAGDIRALRQLLTLFWQAEKTGLDRLASARATSLSGGSSAQPGGNP